MPPQRPDGAGGQHALPPGQRSTPRWQASHYGKVPQVDGDRWRLTVRGATVDGGLTVVDRSMLALLEFVEVPAALHCVDRHSVPGLRWGGVRLADIVATAPPEAGAHHVLLAAARGYSSAVHLDDLLAPGALLATHVDGQPLTREHGWPARIVLPHLYGFKGPKWIAEISYHHTAQQGYWEARGWHPRGRVDLEERWAHQG